MAARKIRKPLASAPQKQPPQGEGPLLIREARPRDLDDLHRLSRHLNSVNFPYNKGALLKILRRSRASFRGTLPVFQRAYLFVALWGPKQILAGASMVFAQHGHPNAPHIYFDVIKDERYSITLDRHFRHLTLRLGFNYRGPTEIGSLVVHPRFRGRGIGKPLSYARFLFMAMFPKRFREEVLAELMPPLLRDGRSLLWEHLGKQFTGLTYQEADKLSSSNKEFIISLFPQTPLQVSLLPKDVRSLIGQVGNEALGVKRMLERIGFRYSHRIDPFDGGPHFQAPVSRISLIRDTLSYATSNTTLESADSSYLVGVAHRQGPTNFCATVSPAEASGRLLKLPKDAHKRLKLRKGQKVTAVRV